MNFTVGDGTYYAPDLKVLVYADGESVEIGKYCSVAAGVTLFCGGAHRTSTVSTWPFDAFMLGLTDNIKLRSYKTSKPTVIGNDVWIAHGATIMAGLTIGHGSVIGPHAVVFRDVEPYEVMRGNPAERVRHRHRRPIVDALLAIAWWDWPKEVIKERIDDFYLPAYQFIEKYRCMKEPSDDHR